MEKEVNCFKTKNGRPVYTPAAVRLSRLGLCAKELAEMTNIFSTSTLQLIFRGVRVINVLELKKLNEDLAEYGIEPFTAEEFIRFDSIDAPQNKMRENQMKLKLDSQEDEIMLYNVTDECGTVFHVAAHSFGEAAEKYRKKIGSYPTAVEISNSPQIIV